MCSLQTTDMFFHCAMFLIFYSTVSVYPRSNIAPYQSLQAGGASIIRHTPWLSNMWSNALKRGMSSADMSRNQRPFFPAGPESPDDGLATFSDVLKSLQGIGTITNSWLAAITVDDITRPILDTIDALVHAIGRDTYNIGQLRNATELQDISKNLKLANAALAKVTKGYQTLINDYGDMIKNMMDRSQSLPLSQVVHDILDETSPATVDVELKSPAGFLSAEAEAALEKLIDAAQIPTDGSASTVPDDSAENTGRGRKSRRLANLKGDLAQ